jgi:hypothetical protein
MYINIFQSWSLQNLPKLGLLVWKETIWQPCPKPNQIQPNLVYTPERRHGQRKELAEVSDVRVDEVDDD